jgi:hypothetical protein
VTRVIERSRKRDREMEKERKKEETTGRRISKVDRAKWGDEPEICLQGKSQQQVAAESNQPNGRMTARHETRDRKQEGRNRGVSLSFLTWVCARTGKRDSRDIDAESGRDKGGLSHEGNSLGAASSEARPT